MDENIEYYYAEALAKIESPDPSFNTRYEWLILQIETKDEDVAMEKATAYMKKHYNRSYQGGVMINLSFVKIIAVNPAIEDKRNEVMEIYSRHITDLEAFEKISDPDKL